MEEDPKKSNSQDPAILPSELSAEDEELTTKKPAEEKEVVVIKPSKVEYKKVIR